MADWADEVRERVKEELEKRIEEEKRKSERDTQLGINRGPWMDVKPVKGWTTLGPPVQEEEDSSEDTNE